MSLVERLAVTGGVVKNDRCSMFDVREKITNSKCEAVKP